MSGETLYFRPLPLGVGRPATHRIAGSHVAFSEIEVRQRGCVPHTVPVSAAVALYPEAETTLANLTAPRFWLDGSQIQRPKIMGIVNVTPDSFSDGGQFGGTDDAVAHALALAAAGADILDVGGESTRPGAATVAAEEEMARVLPVINGLIAAGCPVPISIDTRKAAVANAAMDAGAAVFNDVSALRYDPDSPGVAAKAGALCLMHAQGDPQTMQNDPHYDDVALDVFDVLTQQIAVAERAGVPRNKIWIDPGIGFGKTVEHNLSLLRSIAIFQCLGCPVLLGVSRKGFIGKISGEHRAEKRLPGSLVAGLAGVEQGIQILRVHDVAQTVQAMSVWQSLWETDQ